MSRAFFGQWLEEERQARGWSVPQMGDKLRAAAAAVGDVLPARDCLMVMIHRWEDNRSGMSERYRMHYCRVFQISLESFGIRTEVDAPPAEGSSPIDVFGPQQAVAILARLLPESPAVLPVPVPAGGEELRTAVQRLCDPRNRDELCFLIGYASAMAAAMRNGTGPVRPAR